MREANPDCVTVLLTAYPAFETAVRSIRAEVDDYFRNLCQKIRFKRPIRSIYAAASGFVGSCSSALKPNLASSSCTIRAVCALWRMWVNNAPRAIPNISIPSNKRTSGAELTIVAFDLLTYGKDLRTERLLDRKQELRRLLARACAPLKYTEYIEGCGTALFQRVCELDLEGIVAKQKSATYITEHEQSTWF